MSEWEEKLNLSKCVKNKNKSVSSSVAETKKAGGSLTFRPPLSFLQNNFLPPSILCRGSSFRDSPPPLASTRSSSPSV